MLTLILMRRYKKIGIGAFRHGRHGLWHNFNAIWGVAVVQSLFFPKEPYHSILPIYNMTWGGTSFNPIG